jgi:hypothetical protein
MEDLSKYTPTELLKIGNDIKGKVEIVKKNIIDDSYIIDETQARINHNLNVMDELLKVYDEIINEINSR